MGAVDINSVPVGQKAITTDTPHIKCVFERVGVNDGVMEYFDPATGKSVMRIAFTLDGGRSNILHADPSFWTYQVDGTPATFPLTVQYRQVEADPETRTINLKTK